MSGLFASEHERPARRDLMDQRSALRLQLAAIVGDEPPESFIELRCKPARGGRWPQEFVPVRELERGGQLGGRSCARR